MSEPLFPVDVLQGSTALVLFAAAFMGQQDARFVAEAGMTATCVDIDREALSTMVPVYPSDWDFIAMDVNDFTGGSARLWDVVTADPWAGSFQRWADELPVWCELANAAVIVGCAPTTRFSVPSGWKWTRYQHRSNFHEGVGWAVFERQA